MPARKIIKISDIKIPSNYDLCKQGCTQSLACAFKQCPRKFLFKINRWHSRKGQEKAAVGNIVHAALAVKYQDSSINTDVIINDELQGNSDKYSFISSQQIELSKTIAYCLLVNYLKVYKADFDTAYFDKTEEEFAVTLQGSVLWRGKRDGIHTVKKDNSLWVREIKTRGRINEENMLAGLQFDFQGNLYVLTKDIETKDNASGFIYDMIRTPQIKQKKDETLQEYSNRLMKDIELRPEFYFMRFQVPLTVKDKAFFFSSELFHLEHALLDFEKYGDVSYKNSFSCIDGYIPCEYLDACTTGVMTNYHQSEKIFEELDCGY